MTEQLKQLQQSVDKATVSKSSSAAAAESKKPSSVPATLKSPACCSLPDTPIWMQEDTLLIYSPSGLRASDKVQ